MIRYLVQILQTMVDNRIDNKVTMTDYFIVEEVRLLLQRTTRRYNHYVFDKYKSFSPTSSIEKIDKNDLDFNFFTGDEKFIKDELHHQCENRICTLRYKVRRDFYKTQLISEEYHEVKDYYEKYKEFPVIRYKINF